MERDAEVIEVLNELVGRKPRWGFWKLHDRLRLDDRRINHKRLHRVYCELGVNLPRRTRRRLTDLESALRFCARRGSLQLLVRFPGAWEAPYRSSLVTEREPHCSL